MIQKAMAMGNCWLTTSFQQRACSCIMSYAECFGETNHPGDSAPLQLKFGALWLLAFPKIKVTFEREEISDHWWNSGKLDRVADGDGRTVWGPKVPTLQGTEASMSYVRCFLYLVSSSTNVSISHITWLDTFWTDLIYIPPYFLLFSVSTYYFSALQLMPGIPCRAPRCCSLHFWRVVPSWPPTPTTNTAVNTLRSLT